MNMSIIDQRPIASTIRYSTVRSRSRPRTARLRGDQQQPEADQLQHRHRDAAKNTSSASGHMPHVQQFLHAAQDGAGLAGAELDHGQHRIDVGRDVEQHRGDHQRPGAREAVGLAVVQGGAAARAGGPLPRARLTRPQVSQPIRCSPPPSAPAARSRLRWPTWWYPSPPTPPARSSAQSAATITTISAPSA